MSAELFLQSAISGLLMGSIYALIALPLSLSFGVMRVLNFAHGDFLMCAMYGVVLLNSAMGIGPYTSMIAMLPIMGLAGYIIFKLLIRPLLSSPVLVQAQFTLGMSFVIQSLALMIFGADLYNVKTPLAQSAVRFGGIAIGVPLLVGFAVAVGLSAILSLLLLRTEWGYRVRAIAQDPDMAALCGVPVQRVHAAVFAGGTAILAIAACCLMAFYQVTPHTGLQFSLLSLLIVVLGGLGDLRGAFLAGLVIGLSESLAVALFNSAAAPATIYVIFGVVLLLRPKGLLGRGSIA